MSAVITIGVVSRQPLLLLLPIPLLQSLRRGRHRLGAATATIVIIMVVVAELLAAAIGFVMVTVGSYPHSRHRCGSSGSLPLPLWNHLVVVLVNEWSSQSGLPPSCCVLIALVATYCLH
ncbi:hypothetical protein EDB84DRAFT_1446871 [Lactarius hengduanensis]|nr:hypothetical protein EDB84DRAFT_1446871 [Lactarius hengduanensis]